MAAVPVDRDLEFLLTGDAGDTFLKLGKGELRLPAAGRESKACRRILAMMSEYAKESNVKRPLCISVFGPPGTGKSRLVKALAKDVEECELVAIVNMTQVSDRADLFRAIVAGNAALIAEGCKTDVLTRVPRDRKENGDNKVPVFFFDEFDTALDGEALGWLNVFLEPMQDAFLNGPASEKDAAKPARMGFERSIFFFAGGTAESLRSFIERSQTDPARHRAMKVPDFEGRLMGSIDLEGVNASRENGRRLRRADQLRWAIKQRAAHLVEDKGAIHIDVNLARSFLDAAHYRFGSRSIEAILSMCVLGGATKLSEKEMPEDEMLRLHATSGPLDGVLVGVSAGLEWRDSNAFAGLCKDLLERGANIAYGGPYLRAGTLTGMVDVAAKTARPLVGGLSTRRIVNYLPYPSMHMEGMEEFKKQNEAIVRVIELDALTSEERGAWGLPEGHFRPDDREVSKRKRLLRRLAWAVSLFRSRVRQMRDVRAVVAFGGKTGGQRPWGRFPGIAEELAIAIMLRKPVYIVGGDPGAAQEVGRLMGLAPVEMWSSGLFTREETEEDQEFDAMCAKEGHLFRAVGVALPRDEEAMSKLFRKSGLYSTNWTWNGLNPDENRKLFSLSMGAPRDGQSEIAQLIGQGLSRLDWKVVPPAGWDRGAPGGADAEKTGS